MTTFVITRHEGAILWLREQLNVRCVVHMAHLDVEDIDCGDTVVGTLPINLVSEVNKRGGRYIHLSLNVPAERRGTEFSPDDMNAFGAKLEEFEIRRQVRYHQGEEETMVRRTINIDSWGEDITLNSHVLEGDKVVIDNRGEKDITVHVPHERAWGRPLKEYTLRAGEYMQLLEEGGVRYFSRR